MKLYIVLFFALFTSGLFSQNNDGILINFYYAPGITKTNIYNFEEVAINALMKDHYRRSDPTLPVYGFNTGFTIHIPINKRSALSFGASYSQKGQQSPKWLSSREPVEFKYKFRIPSFEFPIGFYYQFRKKRKLSYSLYSAISPDVYLVFKSQTYRKPSDERGWDIGCCWEYLYGFPDNYLKGFVSHVEERLIRLGFIGGVRGEYELSPLWSVFAQPELRYYTDILREQHSTLTKGSAFSFNVKLGVSINLKSKKKEVKGEREMTGLYFIFSRRFLTSQEV